MSPRVLIIDDELLWREQLQDVLTGMKINSDIASGITEAEALLKHQKYALIILDVTLDSPFFSLNCQQFCDYLHQQYPELQKMAITGKKLEPGEEFLLSKLGFIEFISKLGLQLPDLKARIRNALQTRSVESDNEFALIMKGGGVKGLAYAGALKELEKYYRFNWFVGTSAGAIAAILLAAGYTITELEDLLFNKDFRDFLDAKPYQYLTNLIFYQGVFHAHTFSQWLEGLLARKLDSPVQIRLCDLPYRATVYACKRDGSALVFDSKKTPDVSAAYAARCSMALPFVFTPEKHQGMNVLDGGMRNNYPVRTLLGDYPSTKFIGLYLGPEHFEGYQSSFLGDALAIWTEAPDVEALREYKDQTIVIDPRPIHTVDFGMTREEKSFLIVTGKAAALRFLSQRGLTDPDSALTAKREAEQTRDAILVQRQKQRKTQLRRLILLAIVFAIILGLAAISSGYW